VPPSAAPAHGQPHLVPPPPAARIKTPKPQPQLVPPPPFPAKSQPQVVPPPPSRSKTPEKPRPLPKPLETKVGPTKAEPEKPRPLPKPLETKKRPSQAEPKPTLPIGASARAVKSRPPVGSLPVVRRTPFSQAVVSQPTELSPVQPNHPPPYALRSQRRQARSGPLFEEPRHQSESSASSWQWQSSASSWQWQDQDTHDQNSVPAMYEEVELEAPLEPTPEDHDDYDEYEAPEPESDSPDSPGWGADYAGEDENPKALEDNVVCTPSSSRSRSHRRRPRSRPRRRRRSHSPKAVQKKQKKKRHQGNNGRACVACWCVSDA
jgi:hypothetical protein